MSAPDLAGALALMQVLPSGEAPVAEVEVHSRLFDDRTEPAGLSGCALCTAPIAEVDRIREENSHV